MCIASVLAGLLAGRSLGVLRGVDAWACRHYCAVAGPTAAQHSAGKHAGDGVVVVVRVCVVRVAWVEI